MQGMRAEFLRILKQAGAEGAKFLHDLGAGVSMVRSGVENSLLIKKNV